MHARIALSALAPYMLLLIFFFYTAACCTHLPCLSLQLMQIIYLAGQTHYASIKQHTLHYRTNMSTKQSGKVFLRLSWHSSLQNWCVNQAVWESLLRIPWHFSLQSWCVHLKVLSWFSIFQQSCRIHLFRWYAALLNLLNIGWFSTHKNLDKIVVLDTASTY